MTSPTTKTPVLAATSLVEVQLAGGGWDSAHGCEVTIAARARPLDAYVLGFEEITRMPLRDLGVPPGDALRVGDLVLLGGEPRSAFPDWVFEVVQADGAAWRDSYPYRPTLSRPYVEDGPPNGGPTAGDPDNCAGWQLFVVRHARADRPGLTLSEGRDRLETPTIDVAAEEAKRQASIAARLAAFDSQPPLANEVQMRERQAEIDRLHSPG